jgi:hypothetical protein
MDDQEAISDGNRSSVFAWLQLLPGATQPATTNQRAAIVLPLQGKEGN